LTVTNCTFAGNATDGFSSTIEESGGFQSSSTLTVENSVFSGNATSGSSAEITGSEFGTVTLSHTLIDGGAAQIDVDPASLIYLDADGNSAPDFASSSNLNVDPLFVDAADPDGADGTLGTTDDGLRLQASSPAINVGDDTAVPTGVTTDLTGAARIQDGAVDLGAYEGAVAPSTVYVDPTATGGDGTIGSPYGSLQTAIDNASAGATVIIATGGTFAGDVAIPSGKSLTLELPGAEVQVTGDLTTESALTVTGTGPLAVTGAFGTVSPGGSVTGTVPLVAGPYVAGTAASDTGFRTLAFAADATAQTVFAAAPQRPDFTTRLFTFDALAEGSGSSQGAFVPVGDPATPLPVGTGFWLYVYDDGTFEDLGDGDALFLRQSATYDPAAAPGTGFGAQDVGVTLASGITDCTNPPFGTGSAIFFYLGNPYADAFALAGLGLSSEGFQAAATVWNGTNYVNVTTDLPAGEAAYFECTGSAFDGTFTFNAAGGLSSFGAPVAGKSATNDAVRLDLRATATVGASALVDEAATLRFVDGAAPAASGGLPGWDAYDFTKLTPLADAEGRYLALALVGAGSDGQPKRKAIEALPRTLDAAVTLGVDLVTAGVPAGTSVTLGAPARTAWPSGWTVQLLDTVTGDVTDLTDPTATYTFATQATTSAAPEGKRARRRAAPPSPTPLDASRDARRAGKGATSPRFQVRVSPQGTIPVELTGLAAQADGQAVTLTWQTATETNNAGFAVEQREESGPDAGRWREVAFVAGAGTTDAPQTYRRTLANVPYGAHAFRLRQVDFDGTATPSQEVEVTVELADAYALAAYPNPLPGSAEGTLDVTVREAQRVEAALYDVLGRRVAVLFDGEVAASDTERLTLSARGLASGVYVVRVVGERFSATRRVTIVR
jgi:hypothetical protein